MRKISDSSAIFNVRINPWTREIAIKHIPTQKTAQVEFSELDEWFTLELGFITYDFHLLYEDDEGIEFSIYYMGDYMNPIPHNLDIDV